MMHLRRWSPAILLCGICMLCSCHVGRFFIYNFADIRDYRKFPKLDVRKGDTRFSFLPAGGDTARMPVGVAVKGKTYRFAEFLHKSKTVAFIVIRNDKILYEHYDYGYDESSIVPSFSMAKSFTSLLVGIAIDEGAIKDVHEPITNYLPELKHNGLEKVTIENLLDMRSGIRFNESYINPFGDVAKYYYGRRLDKYITKLRPQYPADSMFRYISLNAQLLGMIVERATHKSLAAYMEEKVWRYIGADYDASWSIDGKKDKEVKAFCCFNARPRDYAKIGRLYLNKGNWNGRQIVSEKWVKESLNMQGKKNTRYSYQWWHTTDEVNGRSVPAPDFFADGLLGQFIYVYPEKNIIIVRLGKKDPGGLPLIMKAIARAN